MNKGIGYYDEVAEMVKARLKDCLVVKWIRREAYSTGRLHSTIRYSAYFKSGILTYTEIPVSTEYWGLTRYELAAFIVQGMKENLIRRFFEDEEVAICQENQ